MLKAFKEKLFEGNEVDGAVLLSSCARQYLTGFPSSAGVLLVTKEKDYLFVDFRYTEAARRVVTQCEVVESSSFQNAVCETAARLGLKKVAAEYENISFADAEAYRNALSAVKIELVSGSRLENILKELRSVKTEDELCALKKAQAITDRAFSKILSVIRPGITEKEIAAELEYYMRKDGAEGVSFDTIVVSGENGSLCHGVPSDRKIQKGDFVTMDFGAKLFGYHSDMTRTVAVGSVTDEQKHVYDLVLKAQLAAIETVREGIPCNLVDKAARDLIEAEYPNAFGHGTGHSVGLEIHEEPRFSKFCSVTTKSGMVLSVEPGIYLAGKFGVRIEDLVLITKTGCENLTHSDKNLIIL